MEMPESVPTCRAEGIDVIEDGGDPALFGERWARDVYLSQELKVTRVACARDLPEPQVVVDELWVEPITCS